MHNRIIKQIEQISKITLLLCGKLYFAYILFFFYAFNYQLFFVFIIMKMKNIDKMSCSLNFIFRQISISFLLQFLLLIMLHKSLNVSQTYKRKIYLKINKFSYKRRIGQVTTIRMSLKFTESQLDSKEIIIKYTIYNYIIA